MKKSTCVTLVLILIGLAIGPGRAYACSCAPPPSPTVALNQATAVFAGRVTAAAEPGGLFSSSADPMTITFHVSQVWKGDVSHPLLLETASSSASCGYTFEVGRDYLVYAGGAPDRLEVSLCSRTQLLAGATEDLSLLGAGQPLPAADPPATPGRPNDWLPVVLWGGGVLLLLGVGWRAARRFTPRQR